MKKYEWHFDQRLGIKLPIFYIAWEKLSLDEQEDLLFEWEKSRSQIPERIKLLESEIKKRETRLQIEDNDQLFFQLSAEITELASRIIDLNLWFRTQEQINSTKVHS